MMYKYKKIDGAFVVLEIPTDEILAKDLTEHESRVLCKKLNLGGGFDGFTPQFFNQRLIISE